MWEDWCNVCTTGDYLGVCTETETSRDSQAVLYPCGESSALRGITYSTKATKINGQS